MSSAAYFVTGTDTGVGKTHAACSLIKAANLAGFSTAACKPLAAGGEVMQSGLHNEDAILLQEACSLALQYEEINPLCLQQAIAPHIAAQQEGINLSAAELASSCQSILGKQADLVLIEGAGGWQVPLNQQESMADMVKTLQLPVILVVGMRLGCLNHALLTVRAIKQDGLVLKGWIANQLAADMPVYSDNLATLRAMIDAPLLAEIGWQQSPETIDVNWPKLIQT